jgi:hypothetical protein
MLAIESADSLGGALVARLLQSLLLTASGMNNEGTIFPGLGLTLPATRCYNSVNRQMTLAPGGAVAQLGARLDGIEEVVGSNPIGSTT